MTKVIAEIGINFKGNMSLAIELIEAAAESGAWGVKFQYRNMDDYYYSSHEVGDSIIKRELEINSLAWMDLEQLKEKANSLGLKFGMSFFRLKDFETYCINASEPDFMKVPSAEAQNTDLVDRLISTGKPTFVSTGGQSLGEILELYKEDRYGDICIMHCIANYPAAMGSQNLRKIEKIRATHIAGYSSHDVDYRVCLIAAACGAGWIERHLTIDKAGGGLDDSTSSDVNEFNELCRMVRDVESVLGSHDAPPNQGEVLNMQNLGTGLYAAKDIAPGMPLIMEDLIIAAPRKGISVGDFISGYKKAKTKRFIKKGAPINESAFKLQESPVPEADRIKGKSLGITIPVRMHDLQIMREEIGTGCYEFHLSFSEVLSPDFEDLVKSCSRLERYSIHLPDYVPGNKILDPLSEDENIACPSNQIINRVRRFATELQQITGNYVPIVGSFSQREGKSHGDFVNQLNDKILKKNESIIYPQWLPVSAWYFGGTVILDTFNSEEYVDLILENNIDICLDVCHLMLSAYSHKADYRIWFNRLKERSRHWHLAEAEGADGEGLMLTDKNGVEYNEILQEQSLKVIEVWQGHFDNGKGFKQALKFLNSKV